MDTNGRTRPLWLATRRTPRFGPLPGDRTTEVVIVGAGITGITAALLLKRAGKKVILLEAQEVLSGETGRTTSHLTQILDHRYHHIAQRFGKDGARRVAASQGEAIDLIEKLVGELDIDCGFQRVPGHLYAETEAQRAQLEQEAEAAREAGLDVSLTEELPLPFPVKLAMRLERQAQLHPVEYLLPLLEQVSGDGCEVFTHTRVRSFGDGSPCQVETDRGVIRADAVFLATHVPLNKVMLITKVAPYRTYAVASRQTAGLPPGLYWDMYDPYHYTRTHQTPEGTWLIIGGKDHRVGEEDEERAFAELADYARERYGVTEVEHRWSGQIEEPADGLALLGRNRLSRHTYVATGFSGTGITWGTLGAMIVSDLILGRENRFADLYEPARRVALRSPREYVSENLDYPLQLVKDRFERPEVAALAEIPLEEGRLVSVNGKTVAVYRDSAGELHAMSPVCTHLGCHVQWNGAEKSWDCPCHGGRFDARGQVLHGPPVRRLMPVSLEDEQPAERPVGEKPPDDELTDNR